MWRVILLAAPVLALAAPPVAAESAKASFVISATIVPFESLDSEEAEQTTLIQVTRAPVLAPAPAPREK